MARKRVNNNKRSYNVILVTAIVVFLACLIISVIHIVETRKRLEREIGKQLESQIQVAQKHLSENMEKQVHIIEVLSEEIADYTGDDFNCHIICTNMERYRSIGNFERVIFIDMDGVCHYENDKELALDEDEYNTALALSKKGIYISDKRELFHRDYTLLVGVPVYHNARRTGTMIGEIRATSILEDHSFDYLLATGDVMIVDGEGRILDCGFLNIPDQTEYFPTVFDCMKNYWNLDDVAVARVDDLISRADQKAKTIECRNKDGKRYFYSCIDATDLSDMSLLVMYTDGIFEEVHASVLYGSILTSSLIMLMMALFSLVSYKFASNAGKMIKKLAYEDELTGGGNLNYFKEFAGETLRKFPNVPFVVIRFDVANFRYINEAYGHVRADQLLKIIDEEAAGIFKGRECCVRMTADQFVLLAKGGEDLSNRFLIFSDKVNARALDVGIRYPIKFKRGAYKVDKKDSNVSLMIDKANVARKTLNGEETDSVAYYSNELVADMKKVDKIESEMEMAMFNGEFKMFIQPKWDIRDDHICGGEALVRWIKEDNSMVYPSDFVPVFEKNGFVERLDMFMLESACVLLNGLMAEGKPIYPISVNQSRVLMHSPDYINRVTEMIRRYNIPEGYIELEVTETVLFAEGEKMVEILKELRRRHMVLSMDDFGSGYSSLNMLKDYPFDVLKIDKEFFSESIASRTSIWILKKIVEMADGLGLRVICEGVETADQVEMLRKIGCRYVQGYFYSKPIPTDEFVDKYCEGPLKRSLNKDEDKAGDEDVKEDKDKAGDDVTEDKDDSESDG